MQIDICSRRRLVSALAGGVVAGTMLSGCTWLDARSNTRVTINLTGQYVLDPATIEIAPGTTVVWQNLGNRRQGVSTDANLVDDASLIVIPEGASAWDSGDITAGMTWEYTFEQPGTWVYVVRPAESRQIGTIVVTDEAG